MVYIRNQVMKQAVKDGLINRGMLRICKNVKTFNKGITVSPAKEFIDFLKGMDVVKEEYTKAGAIKRNRALFLYNEGLINENSALFLASKDDRVLGTIGIISDRNNNLPCNKVFAAELTALDLKNRKVIEVGTLCVKSAAGTENLVFMLYLKMMMYAIFVEQVDDIFIQVKEEIASFYIRHFLFERASEAKTHPDYGTTKSCLLRANIKKIRKRLYEQQCYGSKGWVKIVCGLGLLSEYKSLCRQRHFSKKFIFDKKDAEVYRYLCHL